MHFLPIFLQEITLLNLKYSGMPAAEGSFGWQWLAIFFGGLTNVSRLMMA